MKYLQLYEKWISGSTLSSSEDDLNQTFDRWFYWRFRDAKTKTIPLQAYELTEITCEIKNINSLKGIEKLKNLEKLRIGGNNLKSLAGIENCKKLKYLDCTQNEIESLYHIKDLTDLEYLSFSHNKVDSLVQIKNLKNLKTLNFSKNKIKTLEDINLPNLEKLTCDLNPLKSLKGIENFNNLKSLSCAAIGLSNLQGIENLINLENLNCNDNKLEDLKELKNLKQLANISFSNNELADLEDIKDLPNLKEIFYCIGNPWFYPLPIEIFNKCKNTPYTKENLKYLRSYRIQKIFLTEYPERIADLKPIGIHPKIKEEFPALARGTEWGFFDLKESRYNYLDYPKKQEVIDFIRFVIENKGAKGKLTINDKIKSSYVSTIDVNGIDSTTQRYKPYYCIWCNYYDYPFYKLISLYEYLKKKYPELAVGKEWGFFDLERSER